MAIVTELKELPNIINLYITEDISESTYSFLKKEIDTKIKEIEEIHENNYKWFRNNDLDEKSYTKKQVKCVLHLSTYGGVVYDGLGICDLLERLDNNPLFDLIVICEGKVMSCGIPILLSIKNRVCTKNTIFMIHQLTTFMSGRLEDLKEDVEQSEKLQERIDNIILSNTKITKEQLDDWYCHKKDMFFNAQEALDLGLINEII